MGNNSRVVNLVRWRKVLLHRCERSLIFQRKPVKRPVLGFAQISINRQRAFGQLSRHRQQPGVGQHLRKAEWRLSALGHAENIARPPATQILLGDAESVGGFFKDLQSLP